MLCQKDKITQFLTEVFPACPWSILPLGRFTGTEITANGLFRQENLHAINIKKPALQSVSLNVQYVCRRIHMETKRRLSEFIEETCADLSVRFHHLTTLKVFAFMQTLPFTKQ